MSASSLFSLLSTYLCPSHFLVFSLHQFLSCPFIQIIINLFSSLLSGSDPVGGIGLTDSESSANNANTKLHSKSAPLSLQNDQIIAAKNARTKYTGGGFAIR